MAFGDRLASCQFPAQVCVPQTLPADISSQSVEGHHPFGHDQEGPFPMTASEVLALRHAQRDERGISHWEKLGSRTAGMRSYGIGLTRLRKLAKQIGRNRELSLALWSTDVYKARVMGLLIDDPGQITREQAEKQVE